MVILASWGVWVSDFRVGVCLLGVVCDVFILPWVVVMWFAMWVAWLNCLLGLYRCCFAGLGCFALCWFAFCGCLMAAVRCYCRFVDLECCVGLCWLGVGF